MGIGTLRRSDLTSSLKLWRRCDPVSFANAMNQISKRKPAARMEAVDDLKAKFEATYGKVDTEARWLFIGLAFRLIYPEAYKEDVKDFVFTDGFGKKMSDLLHMQPPNFSDEFKAVRLHLTLKDSDLRQAVDQVFDKLGYKPCQQTLFDL